VNVLRAFHESRRPRPITPSIPPPIVHPFFHHPPAYLHLPPLHPSRAASLDTRDETSSPSILRLRQGCDVRPAGRDSTSPPTQRPKETGHPQPIIHHKVPGRDSWDQTPLVDPRHNTIQHQCYLANSFHPSIVYRTGASRHQPTQVPDPFILTTGTQPQSSLPPHSWPGLIKHNPMWCTNH